MLLQLIHWLSINLQKLIARPGTKNAKVSYERQNGCSQFFLMTGSCYGFCGGQSEKDTNLETNSDQLHMGIFVVDSQAP